MFKKILEFGHMVRFSHSLFAMPFALGSMWVAANGFRDMTAAETLRIVLLIVGCMVTARNSAMSFNRIADADIDAKNPRTAKRHLPAGRLSKASVIAFRSPECLRSLYGCFCFRIPTGNVSAGCATGSSVLPSA